MTFRNGLSCTAVALLMGAVCTPAKAFEHSSPASHHSSHAPYQSSAASHPGARSEEEHASRSADHMSSPRGMPATEHKCRMVPIVPEQGDRPNNVGYRLHCNDMDDSDDE